MTENNTSTQTIVRFSNGKIPVPVPTSSRARTLLAQYQESQEFKKDQTIGSDQFLLFYLVLKDELHNNSKLSQDIERELAQVAGQAWKSADVKFKDSYEMLDQNIKKYCT